MITVYTGPAPLAKMVQEELTRRGVGAALHAADSLGALFGSAAAPSFLQSVVVPPEVAEQHRAEIEAVLALVTEPETPEAGATN
jgi:hypothetical protein